MKFNKSQSTLTYFKLKSVLIQNICWEFVYHLARYPISLILKSHSKAREWYIKPISANNLKRMWIFVNIISSKNKKIIIWSWRSTNRKANYFMLINVWSQNQPNMSNGIKKKRMKIVKFIYWRTVETMSSLIQALRISSMTIRTSPSFSSRKKMKKPCETSSSSSIRKGKKESLRSSIGTRSQILL